MDQTFSPPAGGELCEAFDGPNGLHGLSGVDRSFLLTFHPVCCGTRDAFSQKSRKNRKIGGCNCRIPALE